MLLIIISSSLVGQGTGKAGDHNHRRLQRDHLPVPAVISGFAKGELTRSRFRTRSQPASVLQTSYFLFLASMFSDYGFVLAVQKYSIRQFIRRHDAAGAITKSHINTATLSSSSFYYV